MKSKKSKSKAPASSKKGAGGNHNKKRLLPYGIALLIVLLLIGGAAVLSKSKGFGSKNVNYTKRTYQYWDVLDTISTVQVYLRDDQDRDYYDNWIHEELLGYHKLFDAYNAYEGINNVYTINENAGIQPVQVDESLYDLIAFCIDNMEATYSRTNIAFGSVTSIWKQFMSDASDESELAEKENREPVYQFPDEEELAAAGEHTDINNIILNEEDHSVYLADPDMRLDVGAAAKGYICEQLAQDMLAAGIDSACISLGGNVKVIGEYKGSEDRTYFTSAITNPSNPSENLGFVLMIDDQTCVVTSGNYERFVDIDNVRYCHLIDPDTLQPSQGMSSVTVICKDSGLADYLSTALFTTDIETGKEILSHYDGVEAFWITDTYEIDYSDGFLDYAYTTSK
jgi:thiamine biosynthesis lipoprotein